MNHLSEASAQASEEASKVSDCPVSGSRTGKETTWLTRQLTLRNCSICTKGPSLHPHGLRARLTQMC